MNQMWYNVNNFVNKSSNSLYQEVNKVHHIVLHRSCGDIFL